MLPGKEARGGIVTWLYAGCLAPVFVTGSFAGCLALVFVPTLVPNTWEIADHTSGEQVSKTSAGACVGTATRKIFLWHILSLKVKTSRAPLTLCCVIIVFVNNVINLYWGLLIWSLHIHLGVTTGAIIWVIIWYKEKWIKICISWSLQVKQQDIFLPWCAFFWASLLHDALVQVPPSLAPLWWDILAPVNGRLNINGICRSLGWAVQMAFLDCLWPEMIKRSF